MKRTFRISPEDAALFDDLLARLGFIYAQSKDSTRYDLGGFVRCLSSAEVSISENQKYANLRIVLPQKDAEK